MISSYYPLVFRMGRHDTDSSVRHVGEESIMINHSRLHSLLMGMYCIIAIVQVAVLVEGFQLVQETMVRLYLIEYMTPRPIPPSGLPKDQISPKEYRICTG